MSLACPGKSVREPILDFGFNVTDQNNYTYCPVPYCNTTSNVEGNCDAKVFISWMGTDSTGTPLISSSQRFMNFANYNLEGMYSSILQISNRANSTVVDLFDPVQLNGTVLTRVSNPPAVNLTVFGVNATNGTNSTSNNTTPTNTTSNNTNTTNATSS